jgi:hypothetical protein
VSATNNNKQIEMWGPMVHQPFVKHIFCDSHPQVCLAGSRNGLHEITFQLFLFVLILQTAVPELTINSTRSLFLSKIKGPRDFSCNHSKPHS